MVGSAHSLHMVTHVEVEVFTSRVLNFECLEIAVVIFCLDRDCRIGFPLSWHILMEVLLIAFWQQRAFFGRSLRRVPRLFKVDSNVCVVSLTININVKSMLWIRVEDLVHAHAILAELGTFRVVTFHIHAPDVVFDQTSIEVSLTANFFEGWSQLKLSIK